MCLRNRQPVLLAERAAELPEQLGRRLAELPEQPAQRRAPQVQQVVRRPVVRRLQAVWLQALLRWVLVR